MENRDSVVVVTGASSGIGNACATFLAKKGNKVYGTCRNPAAYSRKADEFFEMLSMDITDAASVSKAAEKVFASEGKVDSLICCAGSGQVGSIEDSSLEEARSVMDVNFLGTLRTIKAFLPRMRAAGRGRIIVVGSLDGLAATPFQGLFSASAFALEGLVESLRMEVAPFGIEVGIIELGSFRTSFGQKRLLAAGGTEFGPYKPGLERALGAVSREDATGSDPLIAARAIHSALASRRLPLRRSAGSLPRRILASSRRWLPSRAFERLFHRYYKLG